MSIAVDNNPFMQMVNFTTSQQPKRKGITAEQLKHTRFLLLNKWFPSFGFDPSEFERNELDKLASWIAAYGYSKECDPPQADRPRKCLLICGPCGRGKTMLAKFFQRRFSLPFFTADDVSKYANDENNADSYTRERIGQSKYDIIIDDLGAETLRTKYGNCSEFPQLLQRLYEKWNYNNKLIIATTNLSFTKEGIAAFNALYGERITDRLIEMFMTVRISGQTNRRRITNNSSPY